MSRKIKGPEGARGGQMALKEKIKEKGLTQQQLADMLGVKQSTVSNWCTGYNLPCANKLIKLANILGCSIGDILGVDEALDIKSGNIEAYIYMLNDVKEHIADADTYFAAFPDAEYRRQISRVECGMIDEIVNILRGLESPACPARDGSRERGE